MTMNVVKANGVDLAGDSFADETAEALPLIEGDSARRGRHTRSKAWQQRLA